MIIYSEQKSIKYALVEWILTLLINSTVLVLASKIFKGFYISSFGYAIITSIVIMILNSTVKPLFKLLSLPITVMSLGLLYPINNVIILKLASLIMGSTFVVEGWFVPFFISIFISFANILLDSIITKTIVGNRWIL